jgi:competence protein ComFC
LFARAKFRTIEFRRGWVFSSSRRTASFGPLLVPASCHAFFSLFFSSDCRICSTPLDELTRIPLCRDCLRSPEPFLPEFYCVSCRTPFENAFPLDADGRCALCRNGVRGFDAAYCFGSYEGILREWIHLYKYGRVKTMVGPLGALALAALPRGEQWDAVVPVPLHWRRRWRRGFNQSDMLARVVARRCGVPVIHALTRVRYTPTQTGLSNTGRRKNVAAAFAAVRRHPVSGRRILLVDDVMTTGSTAASCAAVLRRAGATTITLLTVARADRRLNAGPLEAAELQPGSLRDGE